MENIDLSNDTELFSYVNNLESNDTISFVSKNDKKYITVTIVKCSDWQSLYIEGKKNIFKYQNENGRAKKRQVRAISLKLVFSFIYLF